MTGVQPKRGHLAAGGSLVWSKEWAYARRAQSSTCGAAMHVRGPGTRNEHTEVQQISASGKTLTSTSTYMRFRVVRRRRRAFFRCKRFSSDGFMYDMFCRNSRSTRLRFTCRRKRLSARSMDSLLRTFTPTAKMNRLLGKVWFEVFAFRGLF